MAKVLAITNQKGGVGKTTTAVNLSASLAAMRRRVLLIDLDPQGNATMGSGVDKNEVDATVYDVLIDGLPASEAITEVESAGYELLAANVDLTGAELELLEAERREYRLADALAPLDELYDFIIIDCPPSLSLLTVNGLVAAHAVIIPMQCEYYALEGLSALVNTIKRITGHLNPSLEIEGIVRTMYDPRNSLTIDVSRQLVDYFGDQVFRTVVPRNVRLAEAQSYGLPVLYYLSNTRGAKAYLALGSELIRRYEGLEPASVGPIEDAVMVAKKRGLGRGLDALLGAENRPAEDGEAPRRAAQVLEDLPVEWIRPGKYQPRKAMDQEALEELASSIKAQGVMQPIVVRAAGENRYEIIAGERRWRATQLAGLAEIPAVIKDVNDEAVVAMSLIENIQREDLNPMEESLALTRLVREFELTHQQVADAVGMSRTGVTNLLRLTNLSGDVAEMLAHGDIEMGHARALLSLDDGRQGQVGREIVNKGLNVRQTEDMVRRMLAVDKPTKKKSGGGGNDADTRRLEQQLSSHIGQPVSIQHTSKGKGKLVINYNSVDELEGILKHFGELD